MSLLGTHETAIAYTPAELRGSEAYKQIRDKVNQIKRTGIMPKTIWVNQSTADDMKALWKRACGPDWDEVLPKMIAGVPCKAGSTGGHSYLIEHYAMTAVAEAMLQRSQFKAVDNPLQGTH